MNLHPGIKGLPAEVVNNKTVEEKKLHFLMGLLDILALVLAYQLSKPLSVYLIQFFHTSDLSDFHATASNHLVIYFSLCLGLFMIFYGSGHYTSRIPWWSQLQAITKLTIYAVIVDGFTSFALELYYSRMLIGTNWGLAFVLLVMMRAIGTSIKKKSELWKLPTVLIADKQTALDALYALDSEPGMGLRTEAILLRDKDPGIYDREEFPIDHRNINVLDGLQDYETYIMQNPDKFYIISLETFRGEKRDKLIKNLKKHNIEYAVIPAISRVSLYNADPRYFFGNDFMLLKVRNAVTSPISRFIKRSFDIFAAVLALMVFALPMAIVAVLLKREAPQFSPFYGGERIGQNGKTFKCWKFRTMVPGTDHLLHEHLEKNPEAKAYWNRYFKLPDDPRVNTRLTRFIRKASIDELPQLWNVMKGEMSIVGPRPILPREVDAYGDQYDEYISVKPGITGLWQASGRNETSFQRRVQWDTWYIRNWSFWGDIVIILKTINVVISRSGSS